MLKDKFVIYQRGGMPFLTLSCFLDAQKCYKEWIGDDYGIFCFSVSNGHLKWVYEWEWVLREGGEMIKGLTEDDKFKKEFDAKWKKTSEDCSAFAKKVLSLNLKKLELIEIHKLFKDANKLILPFLLYTGFTLDFLDETLFLEFKNILSAKIKNNFDEYFIKLTTPIEPTYINKRDLSLLNIAKHAALNKLSLKSGPIKTLIKEHSQKYWWVKLGWEPKKAETEKDIIDELKEILNNPESISEKVNTINTHSENVRQEKEKIIKNLNLSSKNFNKLLELFENMAIYHDQRKEIQMKIMYAIFELLREIARRDKRLTFKDFLNYSYNDISAYLKTGKIISQKELRERNNYSLVYTDAKTSNMLFGKEAKIKEAELLKLNNITLHTANEIKGLIAFKGRACGKARVSHSAKEMIKKIKRGNILVTGMTTPDFVPAMKRAAAIITDEGGITCHAAIISRELKIPCIVGAKIATKVLKDGDMVEVDAERGIVKILKRNKF